jgi:hypothetical protein
MRFRRIATVAAAVAFMTGLGTAPAVAQPVTGRALAQSCGGTAGYLVSVAGMGVHLAPHNSVDSVVRYPSSGVTRMGFLCVGIDSQGEPIWVIGGGGLCLDEGSASQQYLVYSEGCNDSLTTERWISIGPDGSQLENNHFGNCLSSGDASGATLGGRSCGPTHLNEWLVYPTDKSSVSTRGRGGSRTGV